MPINRLLTGSSLGPEEKARLIDAYERALRSLNLVDRNDPVADIVARKIIEVGQEDWIGTASQIAELAVRELKRP
jgi:hypothetical protein